jgi:hypothetical protein
VHKKLETYVITKCDNSFEQTSKFSLKVAPEAPKHAAGKGGN